MSNKANKITLSKMWGGNLSIGDSRHAEIRLNGVAIGELEVQANYMVSEGVLSFSGNRYCASDVLVTLYPDWFGIVDAESYIQEEFEIVTSYGGRLMTTAEAKREAREWVAETVARLQAEQAAKLEVETVEAETVEAETVEASEVEVASNPSESLPVMRLPMFRADRPYECEADKQIDDEAQKAVIDFWIAVGVGSRYWQCNKNQRRKHWEAFAANSHKLVEDGELALAEYRIKCEGNPQSVSHELVLRLNRYHHTLDAGFKLVTRKERDVWGHFIIPAWDGKAWDGAQMAVEAIKDLKLALVEVREEEILKLKAKAWDDLHSNNGRTGPMTFDSQDLTWIWKGLALLSESTKHGFNVGMAFEREFEELVIQIQCAANGLDARNKELDALNGEEDAHV